jgi:SAM-dependent methyltransferase
MTYDAAYFSDASAPHGYDDYGVLEDSLRRSFSRRLSRIPGPREGARLLDVGAAYGFAVAEARCLGWQACGLEISMAAARHAVRVTQGNVVLANILSPPFPLASFDVVTMWDVLEHLADPHTALEILVSLLRPGGRLVLTTGDAGSLAARFFGSRWHLYTIPEHLFFYTRRSLQLLLTRHGLRVESIRAEASVYTLDYLLERLRKTLFRRPARRVASWPGGRLCVPVNLFDVLTVSAVRVSATEDDLTRF